MRPDDTDLAQRALDRRRREDSALAIPALGVLLMVSPVANIFSGAWTIWGISASYVYIFSVWLGLILVTRSLARRLIAGETVERPPR